MATARTMDIRTLSLDQLNPAPYNPRVDLQPGDKEYDLIAKGITEYGLVEPLVWNEKTGNLVGGHQRLKVLRDLGYTETEVSVVSLSLTKEKALNVALNKLSGDWDMPKLKDLIESIDTGEIDLTLTGFDETEIGNLMMQFHVPDSEPEYDESVAGEVKTVICPNCQHEFPV